MSADRKPPSTTGYVCHEGTLAHKPSAHYNVATLLHNPWSEACVKRLHVEPYCPLAQCKTCDGKASS